MNFAAPQRRADEIVFALAARQHGVVSRQQLLAAGVPPDWIERRRRSGNLRTLHAGVYRVGPLDAPRTPEMAAMLACGDSARVSHESAAALWGISRNAGSPVHVTVENGKRTRPGIRIHRAAVLHPDEGTLFENIPVTTPARTVLDLSASLAGRDLERAAAEAVGRKLATRDQLEVMLLRHPRRAGCSRLRALLGTDVSPARTRSELEEVFLGLTRRGQVPKPLVDFSVNGYVLDFYWPDARLAVEIDGFAWHGSRRRFESDRRRDAVLAASGIRVMRVTWRQLTEEPEAVLMRLASALAHGARER